MRTARWLTPISAAVVALALLAGDATACPNCKGAIAAQETRAASGLPADRPGRAAEGWNRSIVLMMAMPFLLLGTGAWMVARAVRRGALPEL